MWVLVTVETISMMYGDPMMYDMMVISMNYAMMYDGNQFGTNGKGHCKI